MSKKFNQQFACSKMMLPEHRGSLQEHKQKLEWKESNRRPFLDEQRHEELQQLLEQATFKRHELNFTVLYSNGYQIINGIPLYSDPATGLIFLDSGEHRPQIIRASEVIHIEKI